MQPVVMAIVLLVGWGVFAYSAWRRWNLMMVGQPVNRGDHAGERLRRTWQYAIKQVRMRRYWLAGVAHLLIFLGFGVLLLRTLVLWGKGFDENFNLFVLGKDQPLGTVYALLKDVFAVLVILGTLVFVYYRGVARLKRMTLSTEGMIILVIILAMMVADILYDGATFVKDAREQVAVASVGMDDPAAERAGVTEPVYKFHGWEPAGSVAQFMVCGLTDGTVAVLRHVGFWTHSCLVLLFLNLLPYSKHFHVITGVPNVYTQSLPTPGRLPPIEDIDGRLEREETLGIRRINQFSWKSILDFYTCTECGRCSDHCPATNTGKKLSPKHLTLDLRDFLYEHDQDLVAAKKKAQLASAAGDEEVTATVDEDNLPEWDKDLVDGVVAPEVLWACTTCRACEQECPVFISYVDKIVDMRRYLVMERAEFPGELQTAFQSIESTSNPWGFPAEDRGKWSDGLDIPLISEKPNCEYLFWVGCMPSFDERAKKVTRATAELLQNAGVDFAILGPEEQCTGDPARRAGNEYLFQMYAQANVEILDGYEVNRKKVITTCPHCFNTLKNDYPDFDGHYDVVHHTQLLADLVQAGKLQPSERVEQRVAYHDSCYMGRHNGEYDAPRDVLKNIPGLTVLEPAQSRDRGFCCGAGGAQMFKEEEAGDKRVNHERAEQLMTTKPEAVSSNCPFCMRMLTDGMNDLGHEDVEQLDVAELLHKSVLGNGEPKA